MRQDGRCARLNSLTTGLPTELPRRMPSIVAAPQDGIESRGRSRRSHASGAATIDLSSVFAFHPLLDYIVCNKGLL